MNVKDLQKQCKALGRLYRIVSDAVSPDRVNQADLQTSTMFPIKLIGMYILKCHKLNVVTPELEKQISFLMNEIELEDWEDCTEKSIPLVLQGVWLIGYQLGSTGLFDKTKLATMRKSKSITQKDISRWESGKVKPKASALKHIADALNCSIEDLID
ncbi:MAG: helix-turn-helix transcriptional regulator [Lachnospiraceae bacterium]